MGFPWDFEASDWPESRIGILDPTGKAEQTLYIINGGMNFRLPVILSEASRSRRTCVSFSGKWVENHQTNPKETVKML
jgi:hypothetical protein